MAETRWGRYPRGPRKPFRKGRPGERPGRREQRRELRPRPVGDKCSPLCPFFRCNKKALTIKTEYFKGRPIKKAFCSWIGDECIGAQCKYAYCEKNAMLPDGRCAFAVKAKGPQKDFEEELMELERDEERFKFKDFY